MSPILTSSTVNLLDNQELKSSSQESLTLQRRTTNVSTTLPQNKPNFFMNALRNITLKVQDGDITKNVLNDIALKAKHGDIIKDINKEILELCDTSYLENTSKEIIDQKIINVEQLLSKLSYGQMKDWFSSDISRTWTESYFSITVNRNIKLAEKIINIINSQKSYDITDLLKESTDEIKLTEGSFNFKALINLYFETDITFADLKLEQIFIKHPELLYCINVVIESSRFKDITQKLLNIIDVAIKNEQISDNTCLEKRFYQCLNHALKNKDYSSIKKMLEYHHYFPLIRKYIEHIVSINDPEILKLFAEYKLLLYVEDLDYYRVRYTAKEILPALSYAILEEKNDIANAIIKLGTNLNETEAYYKLGYYNYRGFGTHQYVADISYNASDNDEYAKETFLPPLFYAILLRNDQIIDQLLIAGANNGYTIEYIYNELEKDLKDSDYIQDLLLNLRKDTSYNAEITAKLQKASILANK
jgi:hypothetical protein